MSLSAKTSNYNIPIAELTDKYSSTDINQIAEKVDEVIKAIDDSIVSKTSTLVNRIDNIETNVTNKIDDIRDDLGGFVGVSTTLTNRVDNIETNVTNNTNSITNFLNRLNAIQLELNQLKNDISNVPGLGDLENDLTNHIAARATMGATGGEAGTYGHVTFGSANNWTLAKGASVALHAQEKNPNVEGSLKKDIDTRATKLSTNNFLGIQNFTDGISVERNYFENGAPNKSRAPIEVVSNTQINPASVPAIVFNRYPIEWIAMYYKNGRIYLKNTSSPDIQLAYMSDIQQNTGGSGEGYRCFGVGVVSGGGGTIMHDFSKEEYGTFYLTVYTRSTGLPNIYRINHYNNETNCIPVNAGTIPMSYAINGEKVTFTHNGPSNANVTGNPPNMAYMMFYKMPEQTQMTNL